MTNATIGKQVAFGRPVIKPKRKSQTMLINEPYIDKLQLVQAKLTDVSLSDLHNEALELLFVKYKIK